VRVLLIVAPFGLIEYPNLAASLLKAEARAAGFECDLRYFSIEFAKRIGFDLYRTLYTIDAQLLIPERVFAYSLFGDRIPAWSSFWGDIVVPYERPMNDRMHMPAEQNTAAGSLEWLQHDAAAFIAEAAASEGLEDYDLFGFSTSYGQNCGSLALASKLKERFPDKPIIFGGANCAGGMGEKLIELFPFIDYVCVEDGDESFPEFLKQLKTSAIIDVPGILSRKDDAARRAMRAAHKMVTDLDALPYPDFSDFFAAFEFGKERARVESIPMETSRGCWWGQKHHCTFCGLNRDSMDYRKKSPQRVAREIRHLVETYGIRRVMMTDNIMPRAFVDNGLELLAENPAHERIFFEAKANLSRHDLANLKAARIDHLQPGIESLSTHVLGLMEKGVDAFHNLRLLKWSEEFGIKLSWNMLCGFPDETPDDYEEMATLIGRIGHLQPPLGFVQITIDRFSPLFMAPERFGIRLKPNRSYNYVYPFADDDLRDLAYWFSQDGGNVDSSVSLAPPGYARSAFQAYVIWRRLHGRVEFSYEQREDGGIRVYDTRAVAAAATRDLDSLESMVFESLDVQRTMSALCRDLERQLERSVDETEVAPVVERFRDWAFLHEENERMIVLANRRPAAVRPEVSDEISASLGGNDHGSYVEV